jgi:hypothetical protein
MVRVTNPETHGSFSVHNFAASYEHQGGAVNDWVDIGHIPSAQRVENPENQDLVPGGVDVRDPWDTIYAQNEELEWLGAYQFEKMVTAANEGMVEQDEAFNPGHPMHSISNNILYYTTKMVDPADDDYEIESIPPNGLITAITPEFGNSLESAFYDNWDDKKRQMMENIGRATSRFFEVEGSGGYLGVDGTLEQPEFYIIAEKEDVKEIWDRSLEGEDFDLDEY